MAFEWFETTGPAGKLVGFVGGAKSGRALPVVFVHGINMSSDAWTDVCEALEGVRRVVAFDLRGHGGSDRKGPFTADDYANDTLAVMGHLGITKAHVVGTSFGGSVACTVAVKAPERVASIVAIGSALALQGVDFDGALQALKAAGVRAFFAGFMPPMSFAPGTDSAIIARAVEAAAAGRDTDTVIAVSTTALQSDLTAVGAAVRVPALVVTGEHDLTCPVSAGAAMAKTLRAEHRVLPGLGHTLGLEDPDTVARLVEEHVSAHEGGR